MYFFIGLTVFGVFGSFTYYLPELFPTRLRGTGAGFCYNVGRIIAAARPVPGRRPSRRAAPTRCAPRCTLLFWVGVVPLVGVLLLALRRRDQGARAGLRVAGERARDSATPRFGAHGASASPS